MKKKSKRYKEILKNSIRDKKFEIKEALELVKKNSTTKFDESIDVSLKINLKQSKNKLDIARLSFYSTIQDVLFKASKAYYTVLKDHFLLDVSKRNEENLTTKLQATEKRFEFRDVTKTDVFQAKARLAEAVSKRIEAENKSLNSYNVVFFYILPLLN